MDAISCFAGMRGFRIFFALAAAAALAGCGKGAKTKTAENKVEVESLPPPPPPPKEWNLSQADLTKGFQPPIELEQIAAPKGPEGDTFMGYTPDRNEQGNDNFTSMVVYGTPEKVTHIYFLSKQPFAEYPDAAQYPDFMKRNIKLQETMFANVFGGKVPDDVKAALEYARKNAYVEKVVYAEGRTVKIKHLLADKKMSIHVK